jgi:hypothetical protein
MRVPPSGLQGVLVLTPVRSRRRATAGGRVRCGKKRACVLRSAPFRDRTRARSPGDGGPQMVVPGGHAGQTHRRARGVTGHQIHPDLPAGRLPSAGYRSRPGVCRIFKLRWRPHGGMSGSPENHVGRGRASRGTAMASRSNRCTRRCWRVLTLTLVEVLRSELAIGLPAGEHVIDREQDRVAHRHDCPTFARRATWCCHSAPMPPKNLSGHLRKCVLQ